MRALIRKKLWPSAFSTNVATAATTTTAAATTTTTEATTTTTTAAAATLQRVGEKEKK